MKMQNHLMTPWAIVRSIFVLFFVIFCVLAIYFLHLDQREAFPSKNEAKKFLMQATFQEKKFLHHLCAELLYNSTMGYTLFGDKPISLTSNLYAPTMDRNYFFLNLILPFIKEYKKSLSSPNFCVIVEEEPEREFIYLVNKKAFRDMVQKNIDVFQNILGKDITAESLLDSVIQKHSLKLPLRENEALFGILFGFGRQNALNYERRSEIEHRLGIPPWKDTYSLDEKNEKELVCLYLNRTQDFNKMTILPEKICPSPVFTTVYDELLDLNKKLSSIPSNEPSQVPGKFIELPRFVGDSQSDETKEILDRWRDQRDVLMHLVSDQKLVEKVVEKFYE
jgi:hypothetical protein